MDNVDSLSIARIVIGAVAWVAPVKSFALFHLRGSAPSPFTVRMFAAREVALGAATLMAAPEHKPSLVALGVAVDGADTAASAIALRNKAVPALVGAGVTALSLGAVVTGIGALGRRKR
jgi:hypothetical protein